MRTFRASGFIWIGVIGVVGVLGPGATWDAQPRQPVAARSAAAEVIYFQSWWDESPGIWCMDPDGHNKTALPAHVYGEPSNFLHGGQRWFLSLREAGGGCYPDGSPRRALFAVCADGRAVRLTTQADLEPATTTPHWLRDGADGLISWVARRWDAAGAVCEGGIYVARVEFDAHGAVRGLAEEPVAPRVRLPLVVAAGDDDTWWRSGAPDIRSHDWAPDGTAIVYDTRGGALRIMDLARGGVRALTDMPGRWPVWSPEGTRIAFAECGPLSALYVVDVDGGAPTTVGGPLPGAWATMLRPVWSPTGAALAYQRLSDETGDLYAPLDMDVVRAMWDGGGTANLTADTTEFLRPVAWCVVQEAVTVTRR